MKKLIGLKKTKTAVFISGKGSNLENLIKFSKKKISPISINLIISNTSNAKGLNAQKQALEGNARFTGCTVHFVNKKIDSGKIIMQKKVKILKNDTVYSLKKRILKNEHRLYPAAIKKIYN